METRNSPETVSLRDVTLREFGQNVPAAALSAFTAEARLGLARALVDAGFPALEVASTASARVAPAMAEELLGPLLASLGRPAGATVITLVPPSEGTFERFFRLGLGPEGLGHTMGVFLSAPDEHNLANLGVSTAESLATLRRLVPLALGRGVPVLGYVSAAFGFRPAPGGSRVEVPRERLRRLIDELAGLGVASVTLSDLQGLRGPEETAAVLSELSAGPSPSPVPLGYHPHHVDPVRVLDNVAAAAAVGVRLFDASLGGVGGCVTGAPGNAPTEGVVTCLEQLGYRTGIDLEKLAAASRYATERVFGPVLERDDRHS